MPREDGLEFAMELILWVVDEDSALNAFGVRLPLLLDLFHKSSLGPKPKLDMVGKLGSLKFASCQLSLSAFKRLFTCSDTCSKRVSSPREDAKDRWR